MSSSDQERLGSILVAVSTGKPDPRLIDSITSTTGIRIQETVDLVGLDPMTPKGRFDLDKLGEKLSAYEHGTLVIHAHEQMGVRGSVAAALMSSRLNSMDIVTVDGGWDRKRGTFVYDFVASYRVKRENPNT